MNLRHLEAFRAVMVSGSVTQAAQSLNLSQPAVSHALARLRDYFGAHTYERVDQPRGKFFHTNWTGHGGTTSASTYTV